MAGPAAGLIDAVNDDDAARVAELVADDPALAPPATAAACRR